MLKRFILVEEGQEFFYFRFHTNEKRQFRISFSTVLLKQYTISQGGIGAFANPWVFFFFGRGGLLVPKAKGAPENGENSIFLAK